MCKDGFYCEAGAKVDTDQLQCPPGSFCVKGKHKIDGPNSFQLGNSEIVALRVLVVFFYPERYL